VRVLKSLVISLFFIFVSFSPSAAEGVNVEGLPVWIGDTLDKVKEVYQTKLEPEPNDNTTQRGTTSLRLKTKGVWFFFNREGKIYTIRIEAPFHGKINGVKVGDTAATIRKILGQPAKVPRPIVSLPNSVLPRSYLFCFDDLTTANFQGSTPTTKSKSCSC
jgi:hypothetical protein